MTAARDLHLVPSQDLSHDPLVGQILDGRYFIEGALGKGGMGLVYRARHHVLGKPFAIKVLKPEVSRDEEVMERFRREAQAASAIGSPHICDVSDFGTLPDGSTYFAMEYLDGPSLTRAMEAERPMSLPRILNIARQLTDALGAAHARGIVHRDLKPDNVHLVGKGRNGDFVKVLDFGIAKVAGGTDKKLTQAGQIFGTPHYMSPEQCAGREIDHRTDIYALGVMLYEMACGHVPFDADSLMGVLTKHVYEHPVPPHQLPLSPAVHAGLEAVILKCLAKRPEDRYLSMAELRVDLEEIERGATPSAVVAQIERTVPSAPQLSTAWQAPAPVVAPEKPRRRGLLLGALVAVLVIGGGVFAVAYKLTPTPPRPRVERRVTPVREQRTIVEPVRETPPRETPPAVVELRTDPPGADVFDPDNAQIGVTPLQLERPTGTTPIQYRIRMAGYRERAFAVGQRTQAQVTLRLEREPERPRPHGSNRGHNTSSNNTTSTSNGTTTGNTTQTTGRDSHEVGAIHDSIINPFEDTPRRPRPQ